MANQALRLVQARLLLRRMHMTGAGGKRTTCRNGWVSKSATVTCLITGIVEVTVTVTVRVMVAVTSNHRQGHHGHADLSATDRRRRPGLTVCVCQGTVSRWHRSMLWSRNDQNVTVTVTANLLRCPQNKRPSGLLLDMHLCSTASQLEESSSISK